MVTHYSRTPRGTTVTRSQVWESHWLGPCGEARFSMGWSPVTYESDFRTSQPRSQALTSITRRMALLGWHPGHGGQLSWATRLSTGEQATATIAPLVPSLADWWTISATSDPKPPVAGCSGP